VQRAIAFMDLKMPIQLSDIKKQYKVLAKKYHPDVSKTDASLFQRLREAYEILTDYLNG
jgi:DnaJ-class molecular chaperone